MKQHDRTRIDKITAVIHYLLKGEEVSRIECAEDPDDEIRQLSEKVNELIYLFLDIKHAINPLALGKLDDDFKSNILFLTPFKQLQANLRHLTWQTQQIAQGNFNLRVDFMGDFSEAFNSMVSSLDKSRKAVQASQKAKSRFLATMSHELRTPMNAVIGFIDLARSESDAEKRNEYLSTAAASGSHLLTVINNILDFSKAEAGGLLLETIDFDLHLLVNDTLKMVSQKAISKGLKTFCTIDDQIDFFLMGDPTRLRQILINLLGNAIKFTNCGSVGINISLVEDRGENKIIRFCVEDTGIGIPDDKKDVIFNAFSQADATTTREYGGTGLGLAICKSYIEKMGGDIRVESEKEKGSTFIITIPFKTKAGIIHKKIQPVSQKELANKTTVIIDSDKESRQLTATICTTIGMTVVAAISPGAWEEDPVKRTVIKEYIDIILLSVWTIDDNLDAVTKEIKEIECWRNAKIVVLCSEPQKGDVINAQNKNVDAYIAKPIFKDTLLDVLTTMLGDARSNGSITTRHLANEVACKGLRVLLAEDNPMNIKLMRVILTKLGCEFDIVSNGLESLEAFKKNAFDVVLMDVHMPIMNGLEATKAIRKEFNSDIPIVALTAAAMEEDKEKCHLAGMNDILLKPVNVMELKDTLRRWGKFNAA